jgi:hypothetical protein
MKQSSLLTIFIISNLLSIHDMDDTLQWYIAKIKNDKVNRNRHPLETAKQVSKKNLEGNISTKRSSLGLGGCSWSTTPMLLEEDPLNWSSTMTMNLVVTKSMSAPGLPSDDFVGKS